MRRLAEVAALLLLALGWLGQGIRSEARDLRVAGLALIGISWVYGRFLGRSTSAPRPKASVAGD